MISGRVAVDTTGLAAVESLAKKRALTKKAVTAAARVVQRAAQANAPRVSGALKQAIGVKTDTGRKGTTTSFAVIGARKKVVKMVRRPGRKTAQ